MSSLRLPDGDDYPEAAAKHLDDASVLLFSDRFDGAAYLSGYVVECSIKSVLVLLLAGSPPQLKPLPKKLRHHRIRYLSSEALQLALVTASGTMLSYLPASVSSAWVETLRYEGPRITQQDALKWLAEAESVYQTSIVKLRLRGLIV